DCQVASLNWNRPKCALFDWFTARGLKFDSHSAIWYHFDPGPPSMALISAVLMSPPPEPEPPPEPPPVLESPPESPESPEPAAPESPESEPPASAGSSFFLVPWLTPLAVGSAATFSSFYFFFSSSLLPVFSSSTS